MSGVSGEGKGRGGGDETGTGFTAEERGDTVGRTRRNLVRILIPVLILAGIGGTVIASHGAPAALTGFVNGLLGSPSGTPGPSAVSPATTPATDASGTAGASDTTSAAPAPSPTSTSADQQWLDLIAANAATTVPSTTFSPYPVDPSAETQSRLVLSQDTRWSLLARGLPVIGMETTGIVLPGAAPTTLDDLIAAGMATRVDATTVLVTKTVFVSKGAVLKLDAPGQTIRLLSHAGEFMPIVVWGGELDITGSDGAPVTITSWDPERAAPDVDVSDGRAYVRVNEGRVAVDHLDASDLGFWSGETGGFALTGAGSFGSTGTIAHSRFSGQHIGVYVNASTDVTLSDSVVRDSDDEGVAIGATSQRIAITGTTVENSGGHGIAVGTGVGDVTVDAATLTGNGGYGLRFDGSPRASGDNVAGFSAENSKVLTVNGSTLEGNRSGGVSVIATSNVTVSGNSVTEKTVGISLRDSQGEVTGNTVQVTGGNGIVFDGALTSARAEGNTISGNGPSAIAQTNGADDVQLASNTDSGWAVQWELLLWIEAHPLALLWALLLVIPVTGIAFVFYRRRRQRRIRELVESATIAVAKAEKERYELERNGGVTPATAGAPAASPAAVVTAAAVVVAQATRDAVGESPEEIRRRLGTSARWPGAPGAPGATSIPARAERPGAATTQPAHTSVAPGAADDRAGHTGSGSATNFGRFSSVEELAVASVLDAGKPIDRVATALRVPVGSVAGWVAKARRLRAEQENGGRD
ncbi:right-handed parallel beta-helix repeat-containing protein [Herbiconiux sp. UC225_62]|uniref:right-handed parallel beta-helix repeat-containing protein n=1 Tax=Herbiconiux sp. UC225_62 TaxID=3350168 RepID=UPI0036D349B7